MKSLIFAAGLGKRMQPLTDHVPKPLVPILGKPLLERIIDVLPEEITELVIVIGYRGEMIRTYFGDTWQGRSITYVEQKEQLGTGHALGLCRPHLEEGERFLIVYADDLRDRESLARGLEHRYAIFVKEMTAPDRFGTVITDETGRIWEIEEASEHPKSNLAVTGAYILDTNIFKYIPALEKNGEYYINSMLQQLFRDFPVYAEKVRFWLPIGFPEDVTRAEEELKKHS